MFCGCLRVSTSQTEISPSSSSFPVLFSVITSHLLTKVRNLSRLQLLFSSFAPSMPSSVAEKWLSKSLTPPFYPLPLPGSDPLHLPLFFLPPLTCDCSLVCLSWSSSVAGEGPLSLTPFECSGLSWELVLLTRMLRGCVSSPCVHSSLPPSWPLRAKLSQHKSPAGAQSVALLLTLAECKITRGTHAPAWFMWIQGKMSPWLPQLMRDRCLSWSLSPLVISIWGIKLVRNP